MLLFKREIVRFLQPIASGILFYGRNIAITNPTDWFYAFLYKTVFIPIIVIPPTYQSLFSSKFKNNTLSVFFRVPISVI